MGGKLEARMEPERQSGDSQGAAGSMGPRDPDEFLAQFELDDTDAFLTTDVGGPIEDQQSLSPGERGPTLLEDFIFRQKIQHFDHERVGRDAQSGRRRTTMG